MSTENDCEKEETKALSQDAVSGSAFDFENNFIVCKCPKPTEIYDKHLGDGGYDWCKKCDCPLGDD